jgi:hypothetical protein
MAGGAYKKSRMICPSLTRIVLHAATDRVHEGVTAAGGAAMGLARGWKKVGRDPHAEIEQLHIQLAGFNARIADLEKFEREGSGRHVEQLKADAILLARQIDEICCSLAEERLASLLAR